MTPAAEGVELLDELQQASSGHFDVGGQLGDLIAKTLGLRGVGGAASS
jgi:hypothetical protein